MEVSVKNKILYTLSFVDDHVFTVQEKEEEVQSYKVRILTFLLHKICNQMSSHLEMRKRKWD